MDTKSRLRRHCERFAVGFSIGRKGYIGTGNDGINNHRDFWEYDPSTNLWTQKTDFGGTARTWATGFSIGSKGYIGTGFDNVSFYKDFWEYDPVTNGWIQKADFGGTARAGAGGLSISGKGYIGTGNDNIAPLTKDFWEYDPSTNSWAQKADFGGAVRWYPAGFSIGSKGYLGTGIDYPTHFNDFWEYTPEEDNSGGCIAPPAGLVSWWSGDKTAGDVQGANPGRLVGGASFKKGVVGPGFLLDGINDGVRIPNSPSLSQSRLTIDAWVYVTGRQGIARHIISKDNASKTREYILGIGSENSFVADVWLPSGLVDLRNTTTAQLNTWYHVAMTHDGEKLRLYVNGLLDGSADAVGNIVVTQNPVGIGLNVDPALSPFQGIIDEVQIFNRALTDAEILAIYQAGTDGQCKPKIFVSSITPSYEVVGHGFLVSTSVVIQDENGIGVENASVQIKTILPSGSVLAFPVTTDATGEALVSFAAGDTGLYRFTVRKVSHPIREYDRSLNVETTDTLVIP